MAIRLTPLQPNQDFRVGTILHESWRLFRARPIPYLLTVIVIVVVMAFLLNTTPDASRSITNAVVRLGMPAVFVLVAIAAISSGVAMTAADQAPSVVAMLKRTFRLRNGLTLIGLAFVSPYILLVSLSLDPGPVSGLAGLAVSLVLLTFYWPLIPLLAVEEPGFRRGFRRALLLSKDYRLRILLLEVVFLVPLMALVAAMRLLTERSTDSAMTFGVGWALFALWLLAVSLAMVVSFFILRDATDERDPEPIAKVFD